MAKLDGPKQVDEGTAGPAAIAISDLHYSWPRSGPVLDLPDLVIQSGQSVFIAGSSGSGKSTLLSAIAGVLVPQKGSISVLGQQLDRMDGAQRDRFRADRLGIIFQLFNLIPYLSVIDNVTLPCSFSRHRRERALKQSDDLKAEALRLLADLDMADADLLGRSVRELSVGQQQRVAAARALIGSPELVIADEPTSALDSDRRTAFIELLFTECQREGSTLLFVSHDRSLATFFDRKIELADINRAAVAGASHVGPSSAS